MTKWTAADVPDQSGRVAIVTGSNTGIGYEAAAVLADKGAHVVLAVRNLDKGKDAAARIAAKSPNADVALQELDLTSLDAIRKASDDLRSAYPRIDLLINNAGVMYTPKANHQGRFRAAVRHQPPRPFRAYRPAARQHAARRRLAGGDDQQPGPPLAGQDRLRRPAGRNAATTGSAHTGGRSWPTCSSPTSWRAGWRPRARRPSRWPPTPAAPTPNSPAICRD